MEIKRKIPPSRFIEVNYRDLITNPKSVLVEVCTFLNVPFRQNMLDYFHAEDSINTARSGEMWKNLSQPIMAGNYNKYVKELTSEEIEIFEYVAGGVLEVLGYTITTDYKNMSKIGKQDIKRYSSQNSQLKKEAILMADKHDIEVRCPQKKLLSKLTKELAAKKKIPTEVILENIEGQESDCLSRKLKIVS